MARPIQPVETGPILAIHNLARIRNPVQPAEAMERAGNTISTVVPMGTESAA